MVNQSRIFLFFIGLMLVLFSRVSTSADSLTVSTDRDKVEQGDVISLYIEANFQTLGKQLEYDSLEQDFEILSRQRSNFYQIINGRQEAKTRWHFRVLPKSTGLMTIPVITLGKVQSAPYQIEVTPSKPRDSGEIPAYFMEVELNQNQVFVQQETLYTLRFYHQGKLISGNIRPPHFGKALTDTLKDEKVFDKLIDGNYYTVYEWVYAFYPQSSGTVTIQAPEFTGLVQINRRQKAITEPGQELSLEVLPIPKAFPQIHNWLPAKSVFLKQEWKNLPQKIRVGDSLTRVITLQVFGQKANQLPIITTDAGTGYKIYKQQPLTHEEKLNDGIISQIEIIQTIVPTQDGVLNLPEQKIYWWNTDSNQLETLFLENRQFEVQPGMVQPDYSQTKPLQPETSTAALQKAPSGEVNIWMWLSALFAAAWLTTLLIWRYQIKKLKGKTQHLEIEPKTTHITSKSIEWCQTPANEFYQQLRDYSLKHLNRPIQKALNTPEAQQLLEQLEQHLYFDGDWSQHSQQNLCAIVKKLQTPKDTHSKDQNRDTQLSELYGKNSF